MSRTHSALGVCLALLAFAVVLVPAASASTFKAGEYPATLHGGQETTHEIVLTDNNNLKVTCTTVTLTGTLASESSTVDLHPEYSGCTAFGLNATVTTTGCDYRLHSGEKSGEAWAGAGEVVCEAGSDIIISTLTCQVKVHQTLKEKVLAFEFEVKLVFGVKILVPRFYWKSVEYTVSKDGIGCPLKPVGEYKELDYSGSSAISAAGTDFYVE